MDTLWEALEKYAKYLDMEVFVCSRAEISRLVGNLDYQRKMVGVDGFCDYESSLIWVYNRSTNPKSFVLAHELAHAILDRDLSEYWKNKKRYELRANRVAAIVYEKTSRILPPWFQFTPPEFDELTAQRIADQILEFYIA